MSDNTHTHTRAKTFSMPGVDCLAFGKTIGSQLVGDNNFVTALASATTGSTLYANTVVANSITGLSAYFNDMTGNNAYFNNMTDLSVCFTNMTGNNAYFNNMTGISSYFNDSSPTFDNTFELNSGSINTTNASSLSWTSLTTLHLRTR